MKPFAIVFGIDNNYIQQLAVCIKSLLSTNPNKSFLFFILCLNVPHESKKRLESWLMAEKQVVSFIDVRPELVSALPIKKSDYISLASYLRLFIPKLIPSDIDYILYSDADILFNGSIDPLYEIDLTSFAIAAVEDAPNQHPRRLNYDNRFSYFNAGFLLLNLKLLRQINFTSKALEYIKENYSKIILHDQDVMNALLHEKVIFLPLKWNMLDCYYPHSPNLLEIYNPTFEQSKAEAIIIHFSGPIKPWHIGCRHPLKKIYQDYEKKIPIKTNIDRWKGLKAFPPRIRWMIFIRLPWNFIYFMDDIIQRIKKRLRIT